MEIGEVRAEHIQTDQLGTRVQVTGERTRTVQVLRAYEDALTTRATASAPGAFLIRPQRKTNPRNFVTNLVDRSTKPEWGPQSQQMRATWLVEHMSTGTPVAVLLEAAGLQSLDALARYMRFVAPITAASARIQLRSQRTSAADEWDYLPDVCPVAEYRDPSIDPLRHAHQIDTRAPTRP